MYLAFDSGLGLSACLMHFTLLCNNAYLSRFVLFLCDFGYSVYHLSLPLFSQCLCTLILFVCSSSMVATGSSGWGS